MNISHEIDPSRPVSNDSIIRRRSTSYENRKQEKVPSNSIQNPLLHEESEDVSDDITTQNTHGTSGKSRVPVPVTRSDSYGVYPESDVENVISEKDGQHKKEETDKEDGIHPFLKLISYTSLILDNKGSVARDHLANERTFLAWIRTALGFIIVGIGFTQFFRLEHKTSVALIDGNGYDIYQDRIHHAFRQLARPVGTISIILGLVTMIFGVYRYYQVQLMLTHGYFPATRITIVVLLVLNLVVLILLLILNVKITLSD